MPQEEFPRTSILEPTKQNDKGQDLPFHFLICQLLCKVMSERERQTPHDIIYMWDLKYDTNESIYATETESQT